MTFCRKERGSWQVGTDVWSGLEDLEMGGGGVVSVNDGEAIVALQKAVSRSLQLHLRVLRAWAIS